MKKTIKVKHEVEREVVLEQRCNKCGELCTTPSLETDLAMHPANGREREWYGLIDAEFTTGYFSDALVDGHKYTFSMCEPCLKALFETFTIPPDDFNYLA